MTLTVLKIIVLSLALANVGYFLWERGFQTSADVPVPAPATLKLTSEAPQGVPPGHPDTPAAQMP